MTVVTVVTVVTKGTEVTVVKSDFKDVSWLLKSTKKLFIDQKLNSPKICYLYIFSPKKIHQKTIIDQTICISQEKKHCFHKIGSQNLMSMFYLKPT